MRLISQGCFGVQAGPRRIPRRAYTPYVGLVTIIATESLTKRYPNGVTALSELTVGVQPGVIGLVGANGAGKSTLIKILLGLLPASSGSVRVLGLDPVTEADQIRARVGYMPEHDCLPPD